MVEPHADHSAYALFIFKFQDGSTFNFFLVLLDYLINDNNLHLLRIFYKLLTESTEGDWKVMRFTYTNISKMKSNSVV